MFSLLVSSVLLAQGCHRPGSTGPTNGPATAAVRLRVATSGDYRPFSDWPESAAEPDGFSADVARAFARDSGLEIEWIRFRWPSLLDDLSTGRFDLAISGITVRPERSIAGRFSLPLTTSGAVVLVRDPSGVHTVETLDQPGVRLAVNAGGHLERVARAHFPRAIVEAVPDNADVLNRLHEDGVLGVVTDTLEAPHWQSRTDQVLRPIGPFTQDRKAALFPPNRGVLARRFDAWLIRAEANGDLARLRRKHALPPNPTAAPLPALLASLDERLSLMRSVARVKQVLDLPVEDLEREERVLEAAWRSVEQAALAEGARMPNRDAVDRLFRAQIEAAKWIQSTALRSEPESELASEAEAEATAESRTASASATRARIELDEALRPALIRLGDRISRLVVNVAANGTQRSTFEATANALSRHGLPESHLRALHEALVSLLPTATGPASAPPPRPAIRDTAPNA